MHASPVGSDHQKPEHRFQNAVRKTFPIRGERKDLRLRRISSHIPAIAQESHTLDQAEFLAQCLHTALRGTIKHKAVMKGAAEV
jgi:hypothetical protein